MTKKNSILTIIKCIILPFFLYLFINFIVSFLFTLFSSNENVNVILIQGVINLVSIIILLPLYICTKKHLLVKNHFNYNRQLLYIIPLGISICIICNMFLQYLPSFENNRVSKAILELVKDNLLLTIIIVNIITPIMEELLFRGFIFDTIKYISNYIVAIIISALLFGLIHGNLVQFIYALIAGIFIGYVRYKFNNLICPIFMHIVMNFSSLIFVTDIISVVGIQKQLFICFIFLSIIIISLIRIRSYNTTYIDDLNV